MQCCGLLVILIAAVIVSGPTVGLSFLYTRQQEKTVQVCNTQTDAFQVYSKSEVVLMKDVCMTVPQPEVTNWTLYTASCDRKIKSHFHHFNQNSSGSEIILFYRLYMVGASYIDSVKLESDVEFTILYQKTDSAEKARTYNQFTCATNGQTLKLKEPFEKENHAGYYVVLCMSFTESYEGVVSMNISESHYVTEESTHNCTSRERSGAKKLLCCGDGFSNPYSRHNCVYLSRDHHRLPYSDLIPVDVIITYADSAITLLIVAMSLTVIIAVVLLALIYFVEVKRRR